VREGETLAAVYILGVVYWADMGFSKLEWAWPFNRGKLLTNNHLGK
jgi:hypothetical protein